MALGKRKVFIVCWFGFFFLHITYVCSVCIGVITAAQRWKTNFVLHIQGISGHHAEASFMVAETVHIIV